jgi:hypothetical protein
MTDSEFAHEQLRVIRSLMERATLYRAISAPTALVGGLLSLGGFATAYYAKHHRQHALSSEEFLIVWLVILALTGLTNLVFLWRGSVHRQEPFFSAGMRCALTSLAPALIAAGMLTFLIHHPIQLAVAWLTLYGMALLATQQFAPRSLVFLGAAFFVTGLGLLPTWRHFFVPPGHGEPSALVVSGILAATFGGYHLAYAAAVWAFGEERAEAGAATTGAGHV